LLLKSKGYFYSGHVSELSSCAWHPKDAQIFLTSSADSTIRWVAVDISLS